MAHSVRGVAARGRGEVALFPSRTTYRAHPSLPLPQIRSISQHLNHIHQPIFTPCRSTVRTSAATSPLRATSPSSSPARPRPTTSTSTSTSTSSSTRPRRSLSTTRAPTLPSAVLDHLHVTADLYHVPFRLLISYVQATITSTPGGDARAPPPQIPAPQAQAVATDLRERVHILREDLDLEPRVIVRHLLAIPGRKSRGRGRQPCPHHWTRLSALELRGVLALWRDAGEEELLKYAPLVALRYSSPSSLPEYAPSDLAPTSPALVPPTTIRTGEEKGLESAVVASGGGELSARPPPHIVGIQRALAAIAALRALDGDDFTTTLGASSSTSSSLSSTTLQKIIRQQPRALELGAALPHVIYGLAQRLEMDPGRVVRMVRRWPGCLLLSRDKVDANLALFTQELGMTTQQAGLVFSKCPSLLGNSVAEKLKPGLIFLFELGFTKRQVISVISGCPNILSLDVWGPRMHHKVMHCRESQVTIEEAVAHPQLFTYSLRHRLGPRLHALRAYRARQVAEAKACGGDLAPLRPGDLAQQLIPTAQASAVKLGVATDEYVRALEAWAEDEYPRLEARWTEEYQNHRRDMTIGETDGGEMVADEANVKRDVDDERNASSLSSSSFSTSSSSSWWSTVMLSEVGLDETAPIQGWMALPRWMEVHGEEPED